MHLLFNLGVINDLIYNKSVVLVGDLNWNYIDVNGHVVIHTLFGGLFGKFYSVTVNNRLFGTFYDRLFANSQYHQKLV
jgi:hypothetical protein